MISDAEAKAIAKAIVTIAESIAARVFFALGAGCIAAALVQSLTAGLGDLLADDPAPAEPGVHVYLSDPLGAVPPIAVVAFALLVASLIVERPRKRKRKRRTPVAEGDPTP